MGTVTALLFGILIGGTLGAIGVVLTYKESDLIREYEIRIFELEKENDELRSKDVTIPDEEYHPENMERMTAKEIKYGGF